MFEELAQWRYPKEFRIARPNLPLAEIQGAAQFILDGLASPGLVASVPLERGKDSVALAIPQLADLVTGLWRLREKMLDGETGRPLEEMRRAFRHLESAWDILAQVGVQVQEHSRSRYDPGLSLKVVAFQPTPGLDCKTVIETLKPTVYMKGQRIQVGEVVVGTPESRGP